MVRGGEFVRKHLVDEECHDATTVLTRFSPKVFLIPSTIDAMAFGAGVLNLRICKRGFKDREVFDL